VTDDATGCRDEPADGPLLTIGAFARTSRLSIKALRLYDENGLLPPMRIDPATGYRFYAPAQLERARLVAWLRRLGMPLVAIRRVCEAAQDDRAAAAELIRGYWRAVEADTAARRELADFLIAQLSEEKESTMTDKVNAGGAENTQNLGGAAAASTAAAGRLDVRYAALSDRGLVREVNQDAAFAGPRLLAVADGFGEHGAPASRAAIDALRGFGDQAAPAAVGSGDLLNLLHDAALRADDAVRDAAGGTTLTAMLWTGSQLALVHIGDSRAYLLRDDEFFQITQDHTLVRSMVDEGRITPQEALSHPQRSLLVRALGGESAPDPQLHVADVRAGDRYLLCTDGLSATVRDEELRTALAAAADPAAAVHDLVALSRDAGGPDNVACVVADLVPAAAQAAAA
jgi:protein phosphatase